MAQTIYRYRTSDGREFDSERTAREEQDKMDKASQNFPSFLEKAHKGDPIAQYNAGHCYFYGWGVGKDLKSAFYWFSKAAEKGVYEAKDKISSIYEQGEIGRKVKHTFSNGDVYEGYVYSGERVGVGKYTCKENGYVYEGDYFNSWQNGEGRLTHSDGTFEEGIWEDNELVESKDIGYKPLVFTGLKETSASSNSSSSSSSRSSTSSTAIGGTSSIIVKIIGAVIGAVIGGILLKFLPSLIAVIGGGVAGWFLGATLKKKFIVIGIIAVVVLLFGQRIIGSIGNKPSITQTQTATVTVTSDALNLRSGPGTSHNIVKTISRGDTLAVTGAAENGWLPVTHGSDTGYVSADMTSFGKASTETQTQTPTSFSDLIGTWKRDNYGNTLTFTANTLKASNQDYKWDFVSVSGSSFSIRSEYNSGANINISLTNGNMIISGDSGGGEDNWNGTWKKQ